MNQPSLETRARPVVISAAFYLCLDLLACPMNLIRLKSDICHSFTAADSPLIIIIMLFPYFYCMFGKFSTSKVKHTLCRIQGFNARIRSLGTGQCSRWAILLTFSSLDACFPSSKPQAVFLKCSLRYKCTSFRFTSTSEDL